METGPKNMRNHRTPSTVASLTIDIPTINQGDYITPDITPSVEPEVDVENEVDVETDVDTETESNNDEDINNGSDSDSESNADSDSTDDSNGYVYEDAGKAANAVSTPYPGYPEYMYAYNNIINMWYLFTIRCSPSSIIPTIGTCISVAYNISAVYIFWIILHYVTAHLYLRYCAPSTLYGFLVSPFLVPAPHCVGMRWIFNRCGSVIEGMWVLIGTWICSISISQQTPSQQTPPILPLLDVPKLKPKMT